MRLIEFKKWYVSIGVLGTILVFIATNYWSYTAGGNSERTLLINTLSQYRSFYDEVRKKYKIACGRDGKLQGLYLSQFNSMLPVIEDEIESPYDNPCPSLSPPSPVKNISFCQKWETWEEFLKDPEPSMSLNFKDATIIYPLDDEWKKTIINWHEQMLEAKAIADKQCPEGEPCTYKFKAEIIEKSK